MTCEPFYLFREEINPCSYKLYVFRDFSSKDNNLNKDLLALIDVIRQRIHPPSSIQVICHDPSSLNTKKVTSRMGSDCDIEYTAYEDVDERIFNLGILNIVKENNVVQTAPTGMMFKKTSGKESHYFIKASVALMEYSQVCFLALALRNKISPEKIKGIIRVYIDTSAIMSLIQAMIHYLNVYKGEDFNPRIINFKSYEFGDPVEMNNKEAFTIISASTSGGLRKKLQVDSDKCLTLFCDVDNEMTLFRTTTPEPHKIESPQLIPLLTEDFSIEFSKSREVVITKTMVDSLDKKKIIKTLLGEDFGKVQFKFIRDEIKNRNCLNFNHSVEKIAKILKDKGYLEDVFEHALSATRNNHIIADYQEHSFELFKQGKIVDKDEFIRSKKDDYGFDGCNVIVLLNQTTNHELLTISRKLREFENLKVNYVIGVLLTDSFSQSKRLESNICFNNTDFKYPFYCWLNLPLLNIIEGKLGSENLSRGFVFYEGEKYQTLTKEQVYLVICFVLELLRHDKQLIDNIAFHNVIAPVNFSRFNDSLLQLSILFAAKGRELNFQSNPDLSREMKDVILDLLKAKEDVGKEFIKAVKDGRVVLAGEDLEKIRQGNSSIFKPETGI